jgi:ribonuclease HI
MVPEQPKSKAPSPPTLIEIYTDISKDGGKVGAGVAIYSYKQLVKQRKYKLHNSCSNKQAEQTAILEALKQLSKL